MRMRRKARKGLFPRPLRSQPEELLNVHELDLSRVGLLYPGYRNTHPWVGKVRDPRRHERYQSLRSEPVVFTKMQDG